MLRSTLVVAALLAAAPAAGQVSAVRLRSDNDAYRFWVPMAIRPDQEYSNGLELAATLAGPAGWRRLAGGAGRCGAEGSRCATTTLRLGQKIFTPRVDGESALPGERPYAGWLYAGAAAALATGRARRSLDVEVGVTGPPSGAAWAQTTLHRVLGMWRPLGWGDQIPFEPGVVVRYDEQRRVDGLRIGEGTVAEVVPSWGLSAGTVRTEARAGARGRLGLRLDRPWPAPGQAPRAPLSAYAVGAVRGRAVAHDLFLDGSTFGGGPRVDRIPWVGEWEAGVGVRVRSLAMEYRVVTRSRAYRTEPGPHQYATFELTLQRGTPATGSGGTGAAAPVPPPVPPPPLTARSRADPPT